MRTACSVRVRGIVQGVGFRPFVFRLARAHTLGGWIMNGDDGVEIQVEGTGDELENFLTDLQSQLPSAARIAAIDVTRNEPSDLHDFTIRESASRRRPTAAIAPDMAVCDACVAELFDPADPRFGYPYINCTNCGPRFTVIRELPYDRCNTTMQSWPLDPLCLEAFSNPADRRFHAQPVACPNCGPQYRLIVGNDKIRDTREAIGRAARLLGGGSIVAVKGLGGFTLLVTPETPRRSRRCEIGSSARRSRSR